MNRIKLVHFGFTISLLTIVVLGFNSNAVAKDKDCWGDFFEGAEYTGKHFQLADAVELPNLNSLNGENWSARIGSLKVGAKATVIVFDNINFKLTTTDMAKSPDLMRSWGITEKDIKEQSELIFHPNSMIHDLSDFNFHQKVRSLKMTCR